jgi:hypothetical protein
VQVSTTDANFFATHDVVTVGPISAPQVIDFKYDGPVLKGGHLSLAAQGMSSQMNLSCTIHASGSYSSIAYDLSN